MCEMFFLHVAAVLPSWPSTRPTPHLSVFPIASLDIDELAALQRKTGAAPIDHYWLYDTIAAFSIQPPHAYVLFDEHAARSPEDSGEEGEGGCKTSQQLF